jgi:hypothetical protein
MAGQTATAAAAAATSAAKQAKQDARQKARDRAFDTAADWAKGLYGVARLASPQWFHQVTCTVQGGPSGDMRRLWLLALSAVAGRIARSGRSTGKFRDVNGNAYTANFDVAHRTVTFTYAYSVSGMLAHALTAQNGTTSTVVGRASQQPGVSVVGATYRTPHPVVHLARGADALTIGGSPGDIGIPASDAFDTTSGQVGEKKMYNAAGSYSVSLGALESRVPGAVSLTLDGPASPDASRELARTGGSTSFGQYYYFLRQHHGGGYYGLPATMMEMPGTLPDTGRIVTTGELYDYRVQPPKPDADGLSRENPLVSVVAPLLQPGFAAVPVRQGISGSQNLASSGLGIVTARVAPVAPVPAVRLATNIEGG